MATLFDILRFNGYKYSFFLQKMNERSYQI